MNSDHYISLIYKELKGIISPDEAKDLREWENQSSENQTIAEETRKVWEESETYELPFELDHDNDFAKVKSTITASNPPSKVIPIQPRRLWLRGIAAAAIIMLGATFLFQNYFNNQVEWKIVETDTEIKELQLADGSKVWLNIGSTLSYPAKFSTTERPIKLKGEAFFEVSKDPSRPFKVITDRTTVTVLGTEFNVQDIASESIFEVAVQEGKVQVQKNDSSKKVILVKNEKAVYNEKNDSLKKINDKNLNALAWHRNSFKFYDNTLNEVFSDIGQEFNVRINLTDNKMGECRISGRYSSKTNLKDLLKDITDLHGMKFKQVDQYAWEISGGTCK